MDMIAARVVIADTNVVSYDLKDNSLALEYERLLEGYEIRIAFVTVAELTLWAERNSWGARRRLQLRAMLDSHGVFPYNRGVAEVFARIRAERDRMGRRMAYPDAWIAATALYFGVPLATHDEGFLDTPGLRIISANPEVCVAHDTYVEARRALDMNLRCGCSM